MKAIGNLRNVKAGKGNLIMTEMFNQLRRQDSFPACDTLTGLHQGTDHLKNRSCPKKQLQVISQC